MSQVHIYFYKNFV